MAFYVSIYAGTDTQTKVKALANGVPIDLSDITRITLELDGKLFDSDVHAEAFEWIDTDKVGEIWLKLGPYISTLGISKNCQPLPARITLYDLLTPNGYVLDESCQSASLYISVC